jgi:hypothetical protein
MMNKNQSKTTVVHRISPQVLEKLEQDVYAFLPKIPRSELEAGFSLGALHVIRAIRDGITVDA